MSNKSTEIIKSFFIWFSFFYIIVWGTEYFFKGEKQNAANEPIIKIEPVEDDMVIGNLAEFQITNQSESAIDFKSPCEDPKNLSVYRLVNNKQIAISDFQNCEKKSIPSFTIPPQETSIFSMKDFNQDLFSENGNYQIEMQFTSENQGDQPDQVENLENSQNSQNITSAQITFDRPGIFRQLFRAVISKPLFNILVFFTENLPNHSLGWAIVFLTLIVRIFLFIPNQKAIRSQHELQRLQPKMDELRKKYGKNQQALALKTMELYKTHKINPMGSCLPILLQMPFLIGIYFVVKDGLSSHLSYLLYSFNLDADLTVVGTEFFKMNLSIPPAWWALPILVAAAQFIAMKLTFISIAKKKKKAGNTAPPAEGMAAQMEQMQQMMIYVMPVMIGVFTATFPAAVGVYWLTSTLFGIVQQKILYWQMDKMEVVRKVEK